MLTTQSTGLPTPPPIYKIVGSDDIEEKEAEMSFIHFQSTCHLAMDSCRSDPSCYTAFKTVMMHCDLHRCNRNACMNSLQSFYKGIHDDLSLDIAFCLCRKTPNRHDSCMIAQEKLHPACAQRPPENLSPQESNGALFSPPPSCHAVAEMCRQDDDCRSRLEVFEQSCAVDSVTKKCAGKTSACRQAMLGILGTPLRTNCACQGSEVQQLYDCLGWQRLLWLNPCVVESQKDFHLKRLAELGLLTTTTTPTTTTMRTTRTTQAPTPPPTKPKPVYRPKPTVPQPIETNYIETPDTRPETLVHKGNELIVRTDLDLHPTELEPRGKGSHSFSEKDHQEEDQEEDDHYRHSNGNNRIPHQRPDEQVLQMLTTEVEIETLPPTTTTTTTPEPTTTPVPIRYCVVQRSQQSDQHIAEGKSRRLYMLDDAECSELCTCGAGETLSLSCHALCVPLAPCRTSLAYYSHAAPAYQAYRGRCLCYSGRFICMRPPPGEYSLPGGIFLLLGYSSTDEALLRPHTNLGVQDAVRALQQYVQQHINNETSCILTLFNITDENIILSIRLPPDSKLSNLELLRLEKDHCTKILETISHQINHQHVEMSAHRLLSIFKMAEVQVVWPEVSRATISSTKGPHLVTFLLALSAPSVIPFVRWGQLSFFRRSVT
ncbi:AAEL000129-PA [Aedes aegypti]|uniref:AAEL000129-PA n=1 Tax=Aedes aegypti TaxID=7159 RepID=Q17Q48_AEDAE|nr:AAEL000129-PA [Aedes aegypti]